MSDPRRELRELFGEAPGGGPTAVEVAFLAAMTDASPVRCTWAPFCPHSAVGWLEVRPGPFIRAGKKVVCVEHLREAEEQGYELFPLFVVPLR